MKVVWVLAGLLFCVAATAQSARFGSRMISVGDTADRAREAAGAPDAVEAIDPDNAALQMWVYRRKNRVIELWVSDGKVVRIDDRKAEG